MFLYTGRQRKQPVVRYHGYKFEDLKDLILREQLMSVVPADLATFIRERDPATVQDAAVLAQHYVEARETSSRGVLRSERSQDRRQGHFISEGTICFSYVPAAALSTIDYCVHT